MLGREEKKHIMNSHTPQLTVSPTTKRTPNFASAIWLTALLCMAFTFPAHAGVSVTPLLLSDDFDTGNAVGMAPVNWKTRAPEGTSVRVVDAKTQEASSAPYCVELVDNSPTGRAEMYRNFSPSESGRVRAAFKMNSLTTGHSALMLHGARTGNLCSVILAGKGVIRYQQEGGTTNSSAVWTAGQWQTVQIEWFNDFTFSASLGDTQLVNHAHFITNEVPGRVSIIVGYGRATNCVGYVDDLKVLGTEPH